MTPSARVQAAIQLLDEIIISARDNGPAADRLASAFFKARRYAGSKDRRAIRDLTWNAIRRFGERPVNGRAAMVAMADEDSELAQCFDDSAYGPACIETSEVRAETGKIPNWLEQKLGNVFSSEDERSTLLDRAPLDARVNQSRSNRNDILKILGAGEAIRGSDHAMRFPTGYALSQEEVYRDGLIEIQDFGSQLIVEACGDLSGKSILDLCAGAGGKTLAILDKTLNENPKAQIVATDINRGRLSKIPERQARMMSITQNDASMDSIRRILLNPGQEIERLSEFSGYFDTILVDAPCSGTGTWRRNPETRWRLNEERLQQVVRQQARVLDIGQSLIKPDGAIIYAVCSILPEEGPKQVEAFMNRFPGWKPQKLAIEHGRKINDGILLTPHYDGCDGFYFARLENR